MRDMNFFAPFKTQKGRPKQGRVMRVLIILVFACLIIIPAVMYFMLSKLNRDIDAIKGVLMNPKNQEIMTTLENKSAAVAQLQSDLDILNVSSAVVKSEQWLTDELLRIVIDTLPKQMYLTELNLTVSTSTDPIVEGTVPVMLNGFTLRGEAVDKPAIAEFEYNLRQTGEFRDIFVQTISEAEGVLTFSAQFNVKEGAKQ
jgi:type IV pilus assembly protein PilN